MKKLTRILALLLALVLTLGLAVTAYADGTTTGTITIDNAVAGQTYTIYEILHLESYDAESNAYAYKATTDWEAFINGADIKEIYVKVDDQGYVTWVEGADAAAFAKLAQAYAAKNTFGNQGSKEAKATTVTFDNLDLGYYLLDSSLGTLCSLDTTNPAVTIKEKNAVPTNEKEVEEDSNKTYGKVDDADIGQTVNFKSTITAQAGAENYVFHDKMSEGLTFGGVIGVTLNGNAVAADNYTLKTADFADECTFEVAFTQAFCDTLKANDQIVISYTATLNDKAVVGVDGNPNESSITYGEDSKFSSTPSQTKTYTWKMDVFKFAVKEDVKAGLAGAKFTLSKSKDGTSPIELVKVSGKENTYRVAKADEENTITEIVTDATGKFTIEGLDSDTYYLTETEAPKGYNKLAAPITVTIDANGKVNETVDGVIEVENKSGTELPSTGGMGTTVFYVLGGILAVGAAVLLVTKKRMERA